MTIQKKTPIIFNTQYQLGYWTEYHGSSNDDVMGGVFTTGSYTVISQNTSSIIVLTRLLAPNKRRIRFGSKSFGYCDGLSDDVSDFENGDGKTYVFSLYDYKNLKQNLRPVNPQRFVKAYNNESFTNDGVSLGAPYIIDSLVPQPPNYILELSGQLTSQWSYNQLFNNNITTNKNLDFADGFFDPPFRLWAPFTYNFTDEFINNLWSKCTIAPEYTTFVSPGIYDQYLQYANWFEQEKYEELPAGNHLGLSLLPITGSYFSLLWDGAAYGKFDRAGISAYTTTSLSKGPVHIGLGKFLPFPVLNTVETYHHFESNSITYPLDMFRDPLHDYFTPRGQNDERNFIFYNSVSQPNLNHDWLFSFPNEHRFKNLNRETNLKRTGDSSWGQYENASYSTQGWQIPLEFMDSQFGTINDQKMGTIFWKFDYGQVRAKYFRSAELLSLDEIPLPPSDPETANFGFKGGNHSYVITDEVIYSPTIILTDFLTTPIGFEPNIFIAGANDNAFVVPIANLPRGESLLNPTSTLMQFSSSVCATYPKLQDFYRSFYGYGDGIITGLSEYVTDSLGESSRWASQNTDDPTDAPVLAHRRKVIWGRDKIPSFKTGFQHLHTLNFNVSFYREVPVLFFSGSVASYDLAIEPEIQNITATGAEYWPPGPTFPFTRGPWGEKPLWWEGPYVVSGPILRGFKYGLFDCIPRVANAIFRRDRFGQYRDMLEQRKYYSVRYSKNNNENYVAGTQFVVGSEDKAIWDDYNDWQPGDPQPINVNDSGLYELHSRVGKPFNESGWSL